MENSRDNQLTILHFNDVYNIEERKTEPVGGVARFKTALDSFRYLDPLTLFSGDLFQPSLLSIAYDGAQMIKPMNAFNVDVACFGNHEFDVDLELLIEYIKKTNFPWLISNVTNKEDGRCIAGGQEIMILDKKGLKIGFMGLAESEWVYEVESLDISEIEYEDYVDCARRVTKYLREVEKCDLVIALTHLRNPNDQRLAREFDGLDFIFGGHDHVNYVENVNGTYIIKSGSDFVEFNKIALTILQPDAIAALTPEQKEKVYKGKYFVDVQTITVNKAFEPNLELKEHVDTHVAQFAEQMKVPMFYAAVPLETRFEKVRSSEQNFSNFLADVVRYDSGCDLAIVNTGTLRSNIVFEEGVKTLGDLRFVLPWEDLMTKLSLTGEQLHRALENSVSTYPALDGRFLAVSGVTFAFDPKQKPGHRVPIESIKVQDLPLDLKHRYTMATKVFLSEGFDGYAVLKEAEKLIDETTAENVHTVLKRLFTLSKDPRIVDEFKRAKVSSIQDLDKVDFMKLPSLERRISEIKRMTFYTKLRPVIKDIVPYEGEYLIGIAPEVEGRITKL